MASVGIADVNAAPISSEYGIAISQGNFGGDPATNYFDISTNSSFSHSAFPGVSAYGDLTTAKVGAEHTNPTRSQSIVNVFDVLQFSTDTTVSFSLTLDGRLASSSIYDNPYAQSPVRIYDITGLTSWTETTIFGDFTTVRATSAATLVSVSEIFLAFDSISIYTEETGTVITPSAIPRDGAWHNVDQTITSSFAVEAGKKYGFMSFLNVVGGITGKADFLNTGTFAFTDLGGATFTSASGVFPGPSAVSVPSPSPLWLMGLGLLAVLRNPRKGICS